MLVYSRVTTQDHLKNQPIRNCRKTRSRISRCFGLQGQSSDDYKPKGTQAKLGELSVPWNAVFLLKTVDAMSTMAMTTRLIHTQRIHGTILYIYLYQW